MESFSTKMYPERVSADIDKKVERLQAVIEGEIPAWEISESERA